MRIGKARAEKVAALAELAKADGETFAAFAERAGIQAAYLYQIRSGLRDVGESLARRIEKNLGLKEYALEDHPSKRKTVTEICINTRRLARIMTALRKELERLDLDWDEQTALEAALSLYQLWEDRGTEPDVSAALRILEVGRASGAG